MNKVMSFTGAIVSFIVAIALTAVVYFLSDKVVSVSENEMLKIFIIPLSVIFYILLSVTAINGLISSVKAIFSPVVAVKITAIVLTALILALIVGNVFLGIQYFNKII